METDGIKYELVVYRTLKNRRACGRLPAGARRPGRMKFCKNATFRNGPYGAVKLLVQDGPVEVAPPKRPVVAAECTERRQGQRDMMQKADSTMANDILKTGILLCYPIVREGMPLCQGADGVFPETMREHMDPDHPTEFWRLPTGFGGYSLYSEHGLSMWRSLLEVMI